MELALSVYEEITGSTELPAPVDQAEFERRAYRRVPFGFRATIIPKQNGSDGEPSIVMVRDISIAGISILHEEAMKPGTSFVMEFKGREDRPVQILCTSARCEQGGTGGTQYIIGAAFDELLTKELPASATVQNAADAKPKASAAAQPKKESSDALEDPEDILQWLNEADLTAEKATKGNEAAQPETRKAVAAAQASEPVQAPAAQSPKEQAKTPAPEPQPAKAAEQPKGLGKLFKGASAKPAAPAASEEEPVSKPAPAKTAAPKPAASGDPVWTEIPEPPAPMEKARAPVTIVAAVVRTPETPMPAMSIVRDSAAPAPQSAVRNHEVLTRIQSMLAAQKQVLDNKDRELQAARNEADAARTEASTVRSEAEAARKQAESAQTEADAARSEINKLRGDANGLRSEADKLRNEVKSLSAEAGKFRTEAEKVQGEADKLRGESEKLRGEFEKASRDAEKAAAEADKLRGETDALRGEARDAKQEASEAQNELTGLRAEAEKLRNEAGTAKNDVAGLRTEIAELNRKVAQLQAKSDADDKSIAELAAFLQGVPEIAAEEKGSVAA